MSTLPQTPYHIELWPQGAPGAVGDEDEDRPSLTAYSPAPEKQTGAAVVVCPGGGYGGLALGHEGEEIARWLNEIGVAAFVLRYRIAPRYRHPAPHLDVQRALRTVRANAEKWKMDKTKIGVWGFSAGGHLAAHASTRFDEGDPNSDDEIERASSRPDFSVLCYPVISFRESFRHEGSMNNLLGEELAHELIEALSHETQVTEKTPPTFLFHTDEDNGVPPENSIAYYLALRKLQIPAELHIYEKGAHGVGLAQGDRVLASWPDRLRDWLQVRGVIS